MPSAASMTIDGKKWGVPYTYYQWGIYYNRDAFREAVVEQWLPALDAFAPQLIYVSAGFDAHREDDMGNLALVEADYAWVTQQIMRLADRHCRGRVISCLEGGYALSALARSTAAHVRSLIGAD